jgi:2-keto-4-pentenoate hydratase/2-oxohepta-3-ene-1,7-dioic acid hydratase in catechol pathway
MDNSRRDFFQKSTIAAAGMISLTSGVSKAEPQDPDHMAQGPHEMVKGLTLLSIHQKDGAETLGVKTPEGILDVRAASRALKKSAPLTLDDLLQGGKAAELNILIAGARGKGSRFLVDESQITYGRLFQKPGKIVCVGLNYRNHAKEIGMQFPRVPPLFNKYNNALAAHRCNIPVPPRDISYKLDYETELLVVMGKTARNVSEADALNYVAGYCTGHDFSARDLQLELPNGQWMIGKTLDNFAPIGPYFVSADLVGNPNDLKLETRVNGELRQSSNTSDFIFNTQQMISYISKHFPLQPGDIIFTGTPEGVILGKPKDKQVWLKAGDHIESTIEKLGTLQFSLALLNQGNSAL